MQDVSTVLGLVIVVTLVAVAARRLAMPYPTLMVLCGAAIGLIPGLPHVRLDPDVVLLVFLPPLLYSAAWMTSWFDFRENLRPISLLAIGLVLATTTAVAVVAHWIVPGLPWPVAFVLGALVSPPDAVAATAVTRGLGVPRRIVAILEGESLVNDATGLVAYRIAVTATIHGTFFVEDAIGKFFLVACGGVAIGLMVGWFMAWVHRHLDDPTVETVITLLTPFLAYLPAEAVGVSGVLATVTTGIYLSRRSSILFSSSMRLNADAVWGVLVFLLNGVTFVLIGLQLPSIMSVAWSESIRTLVELTAITCAVVVIVRFAWVYPAALLPRLLSRRLRERDPMPAWGALTVIGWAGMRGVVSLAAALALPLTQADGAPFPQRDLIIFVTFGVILFTLVGQSLTLPILVRLLGIVTNQKSSNTEEAEARLDILAAAVTFLDHAAEAGDPDMRGIDSLREQYESQRFQIEATLETARSTMVRAASVCQRLYLGAIFAQQDRLQQMRKKGEIDPTILQEIQREIDLNEARIRLLPAPSSGNVEVRVILDDG